MTDKIVILLLVLALSALPGGFKVAASAVYRAKRQDTPAAAPLTSSDDTRATQPLPPIPGLDETGFSTPETTPISLSTDALLDNEPTTVGTIGEELTIATEPFLEEEFNATEVTEETTTTSPPMRTTAPPTHPCVIDVDESEPEFQRYVCTGNWITSLIATTFLLTMMFFAVISKFLPSSKLVVSIERAT